MSNLPLYFNLTPDIELRCWVEFDDEWLIMSPIYLNDVQIEEDFEESMSKLVYDYIDNSEREDDY